MARPAAPRVSVLRSGEVTVRLRGRVVFRSRCVAAVEGFLAGWNAVLAAGPVAPAALGPVGPRWESRPPAEWPLPPADASPALPFWPPLH